MTWIPAKWRECWTMRARKAEWAMLRREYVPINWGRIFRP